MPCPILASNLLQKKKKFVLGSVPWDFLDTIRGWLTVSFFFLAGGRAGDEPARDAGGPFSRGLPDHAGRSQRLGGSRLFLTLVCVGVV